MQLEQIIQTGDICHLINRIIALQKIDNLSEEFYIRIYLVSDSTYNIPFPSIEKRDEAFNDLLSEWQNYISEQNAIFFDTLSAFPDSKTLILLTKL